MEATTQQKLQQFFQPRLLLHNDPKPKEKTMKTFAVSAIFTTDKKWMKFTDQSGFHAHIQGATLVFTLNA